MNKRENVKRMENGIVIYVFFFGESSVVHVALEEWDTHQLICSLFVCLFFSPQYAPTFLCFGFAGKIYIPYFSLSGFEDP